MAETATKTLPAQGFDDGDSIRFAPGHVVDGAFRVVRELGRGGMGAVYLVEDIELRCLFALKIISSRSRLRDDADLAKRFIREARLMAKIRSKSVVQVTRIGVDAESGAPYYIMPACVLAAEEGARVCRDVFRCPPPEWWNKSGANGTDCKGGAGGANGADAHPLALSDILAGSRALPETSVVWLGREMLKSLDAIHHQEPPIVHRDIKPSNLLADSEGRILLSDFGIAKSLANSDGDESLTRTGVSPGTRSFASPEQRAGGGRDVTIASDFFSVGVVLFRALTGGFPSADFPELPREMQRRVSKNWDALFKGLLAVEPAKRLADSARIERLLNAVERDARARQALLRLRRALRRRLLPALLALALAGGIALAARQIAKRAESRREAEEKIMLAASKEKMKLKMYDGDIKTMVDFLDATDGSATAELQTSEDGAMVLVVPSGAAVSFLDLNLPAGAVIRLDGGTLYFASPRDVCERNLQTMRGLRTDIAAGAKLAEPQDMFPLADPNYIVLDTQIEVGPNGGKLAVFDYEYVYVMKPLKRYGENSDEKTPQLVVDGHGFGFCFENIDPSIQVSGVYKTASMTAREGNTPVQRNSKYVE